ncbi:unnamed protein product [Ceratitis capitata]|uniref:(Mediterranean fruit fly) hypothetical protein n=1 Tax=Ceratitis capitata TaxID=7213 RepID=A0A811V710_CERCA|nr:unnamed protein product [Ceratitis capitata]
MSASDGVFNNLRQKLDVLGYTQTLPLAGIPLVAALFEDLVKSTESLRDAKKKIVDLLEEKSCWELGVEPYKCDNSRLLAECNQLHQQNLKEREDYEQRIFELSQKIRNFVTDKIHLEEHCQQLQQQLSSLVAKQQSTATAQNMKNVRDKVRSGERIPPLMDNGSNLRCTKCHTQTTRSQTSNEPNFLADKQHGASLRNEIDRLEDKVKDLTEQLEFYKRKIESRDREIRRLNELLSGGRPPAALAKDCCFKDVRGLSEDIELLQREKSENLTKVREYQEQMHEAMQRALSLENRNKQLQRDLDELKEAAMAVETQANTEIAQREHEFEVLQNELKKLRIKQEGSGDNRTQIGRRADGGGDNSDSVAVATLNADKRRLNERINELTQKENELRTENERLHKKVSKLKGKIHGMHKELQDNVQQKEQRTDEEKIRIKSERDFFQKEYLRLISKAGSEKEVDFLQSQIKSKDDELRLLRAELCLRQQERLLPTVDTATAPVATAATATTPMERCQFAQASLTSARSNHSAKSAHSVASSDCVQAVVLRAERERDCARAELERVRCERDTLREKHVSLLQTQSLETQKSQAHISELNTRIRQLERENRELSSARIPSETHIVLLKEEIDELKRQNFALQEENSKLRTRQNQLKYEIDTRLVVKVNNSLLFFIPQNIKRTNGTYTAGLSE